MKIFLGTDHAGYKLKETLKEYLVDEGYDVVDKGAYEFNPQDDYPDFITLVAEEISKDPNARGIIFGGSGQGEAVTANRFSHVRAVVYYGGPEEIVILSREHNDANILSLGARFVNEEKVKPLVSLWLQTAFSGEERHARRIKKIDNK